MKVSSGYSIYKDWNSSVYIVERVNEHPEEFSIGINRQISIILNFSVMHKLYLSYITLSL